MNNILTDKPPKSIVECISDGNFSLEKVKKFISYSHNRDALFNGETIFNFVMKWRAGGNVLGVAKLLLDHGAEIVGSKMGDIEVPALHWCISEGNIEYVKFLLENGSPVEEIFHGETPLLVAAACKSFHPVEIMKIIRLLVLDYKANVNAITNEASTIPDCFLVGGEGTTYRNWNGSMQHGNLNALHIAVWGRDCELSRFLLENGADVNAKDELGHTPLHLVAMPRKEDKPNYSVVEMLELLFKYNANPYVKNVVGETALSIAKFNIPQPVGVPREGDDRWTLPYKPFNATNGQTIIARIRAERKLLVRLEKEKNDAFFLGHISHRTKNEDGKYSRVRELELEIVRKIINEVERKRKS